MAVDEAAFGLDGDGGPAAATVDEVVRRLVGSVRSARAVYEKALDPLRMPQVPEPQAALWQQVREQEALLLAARWRAFGEALAVVLGWPVAEAERDGMVPMLLEAVADEPQEGVWDVAGLKARVEACARDRRGF